MPNPRVLLMQLPVPNNPGTNVPLAAGYIKAYARARGLLERVDVDILPRAVADRAGDALLVEEIAAREPDVLGISLYTWNSERSLEIARRVKQRRPATLVVVGGPEVQRDNSWLLAHPAIDLAVIGEGEQTFAELLSLFTDRRPPADHQPPAADRWPTADDERRCTRYALRSTFGLSPAQLASIPGLAFRDDAGNLIFSPERVPLADLAGLPSPYLTGYLPVPADGMLMVEVSRWCPYSCSFCLYGRNMGAKLGSRYFGLDRVLAEIGWAREQGITRVHFVEANLNLVPLFWPLMRALEELNADRRMTFYAELRGEYLTDGVVAALDRANVRYVEVGLQTANQTALRASLRRTDLRKWAAGTRRLYARQIEVFLDVILGLPADDEAGVTETLDFIRREELGPYDIFTLQVLPGTAVRQQAAEYAMRFQDRPPYYVLETNAFGFADLRRLRGDLKRGAGLDPDEVEGCPPSRLDALCDRRPTIKHEGRTTNDQRRETSDHGALQVVDTSPDLVTLSPCQGATPIDQLWLLEADTLAWRTDFSRLASHVDIVARWSDAAALAEWLTPAIAANPTTLFDCYLLADQPPPPEELRRWRAALPFEPGYLDRVAIYRRGAPEPAYDRVSPRLWLVAPWISEIEPDRYRGAAEIIWIYPMAGDEEPPLRAWEAAGGAGVWVRGRSAAEIAAWRAQTETRLWC